MAEFRNGVEMIRFGGVLAGALSLLLTCVSHPVHAKGPALNPHADPTDVNPVSLLDRLQQNISRIDEISLTTQSDGPAPAGQSRASKSYRLLFQQNKAEISVGGEKWSIDIEAGTCTMARGGRDVVVPLGELTSLQPPSLLSFVPLSQAFFFPRQLYGGYVFEATGLVSVDGVDAAVLDGYLPGAAHAGKVELVVDTARGILLVERFFSSSGALVRETSYKNYRNVGGSYIPTEVDGRVIARTGEHRGIMRAGNIQVRAIGDGTSAGRDAR